MRKKILVTGGSGYKGVKLIRELINQGFSVINIDKNIFGNYFIKDRYITNYKLDVNDIYKINLKNVYACVHLASIANDPMVDLNPSLSWDTSVLGSKILSLSFSLSRRKTFEFSNIPTFFRSLSSTFVTVDTKFSCSFE